MAYRHSAMLAGANLWVSNLRGAYLFDAYLVEVDLCSADLTGVHLSDANLRGAYLGWAGLSGAKPSDERLAQADDPDVLRDSETLLGIAHLSVSHPGCDVAFMISASG